MIASAIPEPIPFKSITILSDGFHSNYAAAHWAGVLCCGSTGLQWMHKFNKLRFQSRHSNDQYLRKYGFRTLEVVPCLGQILKKESKPIIKGGSIATSYQTVWSSASHSLFWLLQGFSRMRCDDCIPYPWTHTFQIQSHAAARWTGKRCNSTGLQWIITGKSVQLAFRYSQIRKAWEVLLCSEDSSKTGPGG